MEKVTKDRFNEAVQGLTRRGVQLTTAKSYTADVLRFAGVEVECDLELPAVAADQLPAQADFVALVAVKATLDPDLTSMLEFSVHVLDNPNDVLQWSAIYPTSMKATQPQIADAVANVVHELVQEADL